MKIKIFRFSLVLTFSLPLVIANFLLLGLVGSAATSDRDKASSFPGHAIATTIPAQNRDRVRNVDASPSTKQSTTTIAKPKYTGLVKRVDAIAQQITVRIENKDGNGSGVIVAKESNTYYVATAAHVVKKRQGYSLITPTQERITLSEGEINIVNQDLDIAIVKFKSQQIYRTADIGNYEFTNADWVFVSGFPGRDRNKQRSLSVGIVQDRETKEFAVKEQDSLNRGNSLIYTNLSLPGMSGGAVLDRQGKLVGINTGAENEIISTEAGEYEELNFGYAVGIPISTVVGVASQGQIPTSKLQVTNTSAPKLNLSDSQAIRQIELSTLSQPSQNSTTRDWLNYANLLWRGDQNQEAIAAFETAIKLLESHPEIPWHKEQLRTAYFGLGLALQSNSQGSNQQIQNLQAGVKAFQQAQKVDPGFYQSSRYIGLLLSQLRRYEEALAAYKQSISTKKDDFVLYVEQGLVLSDLKRYREAVSSYTQAVNLKPNHPWTYNNRGLAYSDLKQYDQAITDFNQAIKLSPQDPKAYYNRGNAYNDLKQYALAIADYNQAIQFNPQDSDAYGARGNAYFEQGKYDLAIDDYTQAIKINPQDAKAYYNRGNVYAKQKQYTLAIANYNTAILFNPHYAKAYKNRGNVYSEQGKYGLAIDDYTQAIKIDPQDANAYNSRGLAYKRQQQYVLAIADYDRAIQFNPQAENTYNNRGNAYVEQGKYAQAIMDYTQAIKIDPQYANAYYNRGRIYTQQKQYPQAIGDFNQAIKFDPQLAQAYGNRGFVYAQQKLYPQAKADLVKAAELFRAQNDQVNYQQTIELLQQLK